MGLRWAAVLAALAVAQLLGLFSVFDAVLSLFSVGSSLLHILGAFLLQLAAPSAAVSPSLPELHQAILNVTRDATRVADLVADFMAGYHDDPALQDKFLAFLARQAHTSYTRTDQSLSWVLWLYSILWMPLLLFACMAKAGGPRKGSHRAGVVPSELLQQRQHHQQGAPLPDAISSDAADVRRTCGAQCHASLDVHSLRRSQSVAGHAARSSSGSLPPSMGGTPVAKAASVSGASLRAGARAKGSLARPSPIFSGDGGEQPLGWNDVAGLSRLGAKAGSERGAVRVAPRLP